MRREVTPILRGLRVAGMVVLGVIAAVAFALIFGFVVRALWNWLMPSIFGLTTISYWQAFGLVILARLLVGSMGHHGHERSSFKHRLKHIHEKWDECDFLCEDDDLKSCRDWWRSEGKESYQRYMQSKTSSVKAEAKEE
jgi:hypothetical protein